MCTLEALGDRRKGYETLEVVGLYSGFERVALLPGPLGPYQSLLIVRGESANGQAFPKEDLY